jgi:pimeloyl-ACP methyl ester carboxylesterase
MDDPFSEFNVNQELFQIILKDGRQLAYAEFGKPDGFPVLYFHGSPASRLEPQILGDQALGQLSLRIIAPDRPGMGQSDFQPGRGFSHWPADVAALADTLGLDRFSVLGNSGGAGYAAVCAAKIPERLRNVVIVSGGWQMNWPEAMDNVPPPNRLFLKLSRTAPFLLPVLLKMMAGSPDDKPEQTLAQFRRSMHPADYAVLEQPGRVEHLMQMTRESMAHGTKGVVWDMRLHVQDWDFLLDEVRLPLKLFHGEEDRNAPIQMVRKVMTLLPNAHLVTYAGEAHLSTPCNHLEEIAQALVRE